MGDFFGKRTVKYEVPVEMHSARDVRKEMKFLRKAYKTEGPYSIFYNEIEGNSCLTCVKDSKTLEDCLGFMLIGPEAVRFPSEYILKRYPTSDAEALDGRK